MPVPLVEGKLLFAFDDDWHAVKWDDHRAYRDGLCGIGGCKAVDFCGVHRKSVYLIEVKDFRGHRIENKARTVGETSDNLADEIAHKVCDTVAGLIGAHRSRPAEDETWRPFGEAIANRNVDVRVVLWLEEDVPRGPDRRMSFQDRLKQKLRWLTPRVIIASLRHTTAQPPGVTVANQPGAGGRGDS